MTDLAAVAPKKSGPLRWILLGCGLISLLGILGMGGCGGVFYLIYQGTEDTAKIGSDYLRAAPEMKQALGTEGFNLERKWFGWNVQVVNDGGQARFEYRILNSKNQPKGAATVWLTRKQGKWSPLGAQCRHEEADYFSIGDPPKGAKILVDY